MFVGSRVSAAVATGRKAPGAAAQPRTPCFVAGSRIATLGGAAAVENLRVGDRVLTRDNGYRKIRWIGGREFDARALAGFPELRPLRIAGGLLGADQPAADLCVSPQHRVLLTGALARGIGGETETLVAATDLVRLGLAAMSDVASVVYYHLMFDAHEVILAEGCWSESFLPEAAALDGLHDAQLHEILTIFPELASRAGQRAYLPARQLLAPAPGLRMAA
jgi:hypothetical protein